MSVESTGQAVMFELSNRCLLLVSIVFPNVSVGEGGGVKKKAEDRSSAATRMMEKSCPKTVVTQMHVGIFFSSFPHFYL